MPLVEDAPVLVNARPTRVKRQTQKLDKTIVLSTVRSTTYAVELLIDSDLERTPAATIWGIVNMCTTGSVAHVTIEDVENRVRAVE